MREQTYHWDLYCFRRSMACSCDSRDANKDHKMINITSQDQVDGANHNTTKSEGAQTILPMLRRLEVVGGPAIARVLLDSIHGANLDLGRRVDKTYNVGSVGRFANCTRLQAEVIAAQLSSLML